MSAQPTKEARRKREPHHFEELYLALQQERVALTCAIMELRGGNAIEAPAVLRILVRLLRLQRLNRRVRAELAGEQARQ